MQSSQLLDQTIKTILRVSLQSLGHGDSSLDITPYATLQRFRFIHCAEFIDNEIIRIDECTTLPAHMYSTLSYVWRGSPPDPSDPHPSFSVRRGEDADPISKTVLRHVFTVSRRLGAEYLWMDLLSIMQTSKEDKDWQIANMSRVYQECAHAIVLPGGVQRLVRLDEETDWIHRGWTLQEALAPPFACVLFAWRLGPGEALSGKGGTDTALAMIHEVIPGQSAMAPLVNVLNACVVGFTFFAAESNRCATPKPLICKCRVFGSRSSGAISLAAAMTPELHDLETEGNAMDSDARNHAIWQSSLLRSASRPVDMIFSIMGLFGVKLDTTAFRWDDRLGATVSLAREILKNGGRASWMGVALELPRHPIMSAFPSFPHTSKSGRARLEIGGRMKEVASEVEVIVPNIHPLEMMHMPRGSMDKDGQFTFTRKAIRLLPMDRNVYLSERGQNAISQRGKNSIKSPCVAYDGTIWRVAQDEDEEAEGASLVVYAVILCWYDPYHPGVTPAHDSFQLKAMLVRKGTGSPYHVTSFIAWSMSLRKWPLTWKEREFCIGPGHSTLPLAALGTSNLVADEDLDAGALPIQTFTGRTLLEEPTESWYQPYTQLELEEANAKEPDRQGWRAQHEDTFKLFQEWTQQEGVSMNDIQSWGRMVRNPDDGKVRIKGKLVTWDRDLGYIDMEE